MENTRIASTLVTGLRPVGSVADRDHGRLLSAIDKLASEIPELRRLFADAEPTRDPSRVDWYGPSDCSYLPLAALPEAERPAVLEKVEALLSRVRAEGERLAAQGDPAGRALAYAATLPEPRQSHIYVARSLSDPRQWHPVLVSWAYENDAPAAAGLAPQVMVRETARPRARVTGEQAPAAVFGAAPAMVIAEQRRTRWWWLLWLALLALLLIMAWLMLRACGLGLPGLGGLHPIGRTFCPGSAVAATPDDDERGRQLAEIARQLELQIMQRQVACLDEARLHDPPPQPQPPSNDNKPPPNDAKQPPPDDKKQPQQAEGPKSPSMDDRLNREGAKTGEIQVSLMWEGTADLDLHVFCPDGEEIYYSRKATCGGTLDVDMNNSERKSLTPVENVYWPDGKATRGRYRVVVTMYQRYGDTRRAIPFQVRIKVGGKEQMVTGSVDKEHTPVPVTEFDR